MSYKGKLAIKRSDRTNSWCDQAISNHFSFGGYLTGAIVWGYLILNIFLVVLGLALYSAKLWLGNMFFHYAIYLVLPILTVYIFKYLINKLSYKLFVKTHGKLIGLNNFRAYNVFLYFMFFFDLILGFLNGFTRLIKTMLVSIIMMPSKTY